MSSSKGSGNVAKLRNIINVLDPRWGAKGDGVTDDTAAVQAAITYAIANNLDVEVDGKCRLTAPVNIDRLVDGAAYDKYFRIFSKTGGGFYVTTAINMFSSSIAFAGAPVSQLVFFDGVYFESDVAGARYVLNGGRFLRTRFNGCSFDRILAVNSAIYIQTIQFTNCNIRRCTGTFFNVAGSSAIDFKFIGNIVEAHTGDCLSLAQPIGCAIIGNLMEGISGTAIVYNGAQGLAIHGNYFEANGKDIDGTGATVAYGVSIIGNHFSHTNAADYSVVWGATPSNCVSMGNYHNGSMHNIPANADVFIKDFAATSAFNNTPYPKIKTHLSVTTGTLGVGVDSPVVGNVQFHAAANTTLGLTDNVLGTSYGGAIRGYGVGGLGGYVELGTYQAGAYTQALVITETGAAQIKGTAPSLQVGAPVGGNKGSGTANFAADIYKNNTAYANPDYVLEHWARGEIVKFKDKPGAAQYKGRLSIARLRAYVKRHLHLPGFGQKAGHGAFSGADRLLATVEELTLHIFDLHEEQKKLRTQVARLVAAKGRA